MATKKAATSIAKKGTAPTVKRSVKAPIKAEKPTALKAMSAKPTSKTVTNSLQGWRRNPNGQILVEEKVATKLKPVSASKLRQGISAAQDEIKHSLQDIAAVMTMDFEISEIELSMSFNAKGEFLGFGVGGAASIKVKIKPVQKP